jgi:hypothetical protein
MLATQQLLLSLHPPGQNHLSKIHLTKQKTFNQNAKVQTQPRAIDLRSPNALIGVHHQRNPRLRLVELRKEVQKEILQKTEWVAVPSIDAKVNTTTHSKFLIWINDYAFIQPIRSST